MVRLSRAGRKRAVLDAILAMNSTRKNSGYYQGEICRKMGITSQSKIRDILHEMVRDGMLVSGTSAIDGYPDELEVYQIAVYEQRGFVEMESVELERIDRLSKLLGVNNYVGI